MILPNEFYLCRVTGIFEDYAWLEVVGQFSRRAFSRISDHEPVTATIKDGARLRVWIGDDPRKGDFVIASELHCGSRGWYVGGFARLVQPDDRLEPVLVQFKNVA